MDEMSRRNKILNHDLYKKNYAENEAAEWERKFCRHNLTHFLDVARLAMLLNLKEKMQVEEELIYAAALLHDIGKHVQYRDHTPHEQAGALIAPVILDECGFTEKETGVIIEAILKHRSPEAAEERNLNGLLYRADKLSRCCFACQMEPQCDWKQNRKNRQLVW